MNQPRICDACGYRSAPRPCPACGGLWRHARLADAPVRGLAGVRDGLRAPFVGALVLLETPGTKRWLAPPFALVLALFALVGWWSVSAAWRAMDALAREGEALLRGDAWWQELAQWIGPGLLLGAAQWSGLLVAVLVLLLVATFSFSVAWEALSSPFLDLAQSRVEARWYGADPRTLFEPPSTVAPWRVALLVLLLLASALGCALLLSGGAGWWSLAAPIAAVLATLRQRAAWSRLRAEAGRELRTLSTSVKSSLLAFAIIVAFLWLHLVPLVGAPLHAVVAGFATALTLLDIPFSRRGWSLAERWSFLARHAAPLSAFGFATGLVFLVPVLGPLLGVPSASMGGLWLCARLAKAPSPSVKSI
jgi:uncharacterized protein involved in cysteine biosynthesis